MTTAEPDDDPRIDATVYDVMKSVCDSLFHATGHDTSITLKLTMAIRAGLADDGLVVRDVGTSAPLPTV